MTVNSRTFRAPIVAFALTAIAGRASLGCQAAPGGVAARAERTLATSYPAQAARIVEAEAAFERRGEGFARAGDDRPASPRDRLELALPSRGEGPIAIRGGGLAITVREIDALGDGALAGSAVAYPRAGGTSIWTATPGGAEEWLLLDAGVARADRVAAAWDIEGATLREAYGVIEILDGDGTPRVRVTAPAAWAEGGREVRASLSARGQHRIELVVDGGGAPVLADPSWSSTGTMHVQRGYHGSMLLANGKVFVAGGATSGATLGSAEIYDPITNAWSTAAPMLTPRMGPSATMLGNGRILFAATMGVPTTAAELYDPNTNGWSSAGTMSASRSNGTATQLNDGRVLAVGGSGMNPLASTEIYDPSSNSWSPTASLVAGRSAHTATLLQNGKVLVAAGFNSGGVINTVEIYDPGSNTWSPGASMGSGSGYATATLLQNGKVLVVGGTAGPGGGYARAELYDPATSSWSVTGSLKAPRFYHTATLLPTTGQVVVVGGMNAFGSLSSTEIYDPGSGTWSTGSALTMGRNAHSATLLPSGRILAAGGLNVLTGYLDTAESYGPNGTGNTGIACAAASDCASGYCVDGVCCSTACGAGPCDACSVAAGADVNGTCKLFNSGACDDGNPCTQTDTCQFGTCSGTNLVSCPAPDACHNPGVCSPLTGVCSTPQVPDETPCVLGECISGVCGPSIGTGSSGPSSSAASTSASSGAGSSSTSAGSSGSSGGTTAASTSAGAGGSSASGAGVSGAGGAGGAIGAGGSPSTGPAATSGGRTGSTGSPGESGGCSLGVARDPAGAAGPLGLLVALAALARARARSIRSRLEPSVA